MAVLVKILNRGMTLDMYDQIATPILAEIKRQAGFQIHACYATGDGLIVTEVWDTAEQQRAWFEKYVRPNIPADADQEFEVVELHNVATK
jgi:heme-degrading monooxygenase HmoA